MLELTLHHAVKSETTYNYRCFLLQFLRRRLWTIVLSWKWKNAVNLYYDELQTQLMQVKVTLLMKMELLFMSVTSKIMENDWKGKFENKDIPSLCDLILTWKWGTKAWTSHISVKESAVCINGPEIWESHRWIQKWRRWSEVIAVRVFHDAKLKWIYTWPWL